MGMRWHDLLFMHWPIDAGILRPHIPAGLEVDTYEGQAWIAVVPFWMSAVRPRFVPSLPGISKFPELNVRTYVVTGGKPGVWFFSLDAASRLAVRVARGLFHLPYFDARMRCTKDDQNAFDYESVRTHRGEGPLEFRGRYGPKGPVYHSEAGSLEHWLTERYCLYSANKKGKVFRGEIDHVPWPLQPAQADVAVNTMLRGLDFEPPCEPLLHFSAFLDVQAWALERC